MSELRKPNYETKTEDESYNDGLLCGLAWDRDWIPGGPWICPDRGVRNDPEWTAYCLRTKLNHAAYMRGWHEGRTDTEGCTR